MQPFETPPLSLHGRRADEQRESVNGAKPRFCVVILSMGQNAPMRVEKST
jgi:hypothetical protein